MKTKTSKTAKLILLILASAAIISCSKKEDVTTSPTVSLDYEVDCTYKIGATQYTGRASYLFIPLNAAPDGCDKSSFQITRSGSQDLLVINSLKQEGGIFDSAMFTADTKCNKMGLNVMATFGGNFQSWNSKNEASNVLSLSGKTYTFTCKIYENNTLANSASTIVTATWTKP
jgi:hypothetical protein